MTHAAAGSERHDQLYRRASSTRFIGAFDRRVRSARSIGAFDRRVRSARAQ